MGTNVFDAKTQNKPADVVDRLQKDRLEIDQVCTLQVCSRQDRIGVALLIGCCDLSIVTAFCRKPGTTSSLTLYHNKSGLPSLDNSARRNQVVVNAGCTNGLQGRCVPIGEFKVPLDAFLDMTFHVIAPGNILPLLLVSNIPKILDH